MSQWKELPSKHRKGRDGMPRGVSFWNFPASVCIISVVWEQFLRARLWVEFTWRSGRGDERIKTPKQFCGDLRPAQCRDPKRVGVPLFLRLKGGFGKERLQLRVIFYLCGPHTSRGFEVSFFLREFAIRLPPACLLFLSPYLDDLRQSLLISPNLLEVSFVLSPALLLALGGKEKRNNDTPTRTKTQI